MINSMMIVVAVMLLTGCVATVGQPTEADPVLQVRETERAFARSMAERDFEAFTSFLSEECVFFSGPSPLHGRKAVAEWWKRYFEGPDAPFSWEPQKVEVLESGGLALSTGPVYDPSGRLIATFTSIWRQEGSGIWRIIFDKGNDVCEEQKKEQ